MSEKNKSWIPNMGLKENLGRLGTSVISSTRTGLSQLKQKV